MSAFFKSKEVVLAVAGLSFLATFVPYFIYFPALDTFSTKLITITALVNCFALALAIYSQFMRGMHYVRRRSRGWILKAYMMIAIVLMIIFATMGQDTGPYSWVMLAIVNPLSSVNYGILAFYMASTCARAFRARNLRALLFLAVGFVVLLYQAPATGIILPGIEPPALYFTGTFAMAVSRTFTISVTLGAIVFGVRVLMGKQPQVLGLGGGG